jgi:Rps23 Pro-64 3,4-dihydroxylase Tpa1-like proline 4-hydroxylase
MNLFFHKDNFLSEKDFNNLNQTAIKRYPLIEKTDKIGMLHKHQPIKSRDMNFPAGYTSLPVEATIMYGKSAANAVTRIHQYLVNEVKVIEPEISTIWFAYMTPGRTMEFHCDGEVRDVPENRCITVCIYLHDQWDISWGGEIETIYGDKYSPQPNRIIFWSRDVMHRVNEITAPVLPTKRMVMATTWTTKGLAD